jgi:hypothetical protein
MRQPVTRQLICSLLVGMLAFTVAGCNQEDAAPLASLRALPEAGLPTMPGATLIRESSLPRRWSLDSGWTGAYLSRDFGTNIGPDTFANRQIVRDYYGSILKPRGWTDTCHVCGRWQKDGFVFRVQFQPVTTLSPEEHKPFSFVFYEVLQEDLNPSTSGSPGAT